MSAGDRTEAGFGTASRLIVGWFGIVIGLLNLLTEADRRTDADVPFLIFNGILVVGGIVLLALGWLAEDPGPAGYVAGAAVATIGLVGSTAPAINSVCCMSAFDSRHGFPFTFLAHDEGARWHVNTEHLIADLLFWGFVGLVVLVAVALYRRVTSRDDHASTGNRHAEPKALADEARADQARADPPLPAGGTVGGLP